MKMWFIAFALFTVYGVVSGSVDICATGRPDICLTPPTEPLNFPGNIEALDKMCPIVIAKFSCLVDYKNQCGLESIGSIAQKLEQILEMVSDACDKDSELHQELSIRLPCLKRIIVSHHNTCMPIVEESMDAAISRIIGPADSDSTENPGNWRRHYCLSEALDFACLMADASVTCGSATKQLVGKIVDRVEFLDAVCNADIRDEVKEMVTIMQEQMEEGLAIKNIISNV